MGHALIGSALGKCVIDTMNTGTIDVVASRNVGIADIISQIRLLYPAMRMHYIDRLG